MELPSVDYVQAQRPWLALYGVRVRPRAPQHIEVELALIQSALPDEMMAIVFSKLGPYDLGRAGCVCRQWRCYSNMPKLWERACRDAFQSHKDSNTFIKDNLAKKYNGAWKRVFVEVPHLRFDGVYVGRNTYVKLGVTEWTTRNPVHLVSYYRYYRFFSDGSFLYRTSPFVVNRVEKTLRAKPTRPETQARDQHVYQGKYILKDSKVYCVVVYPNNRRTEIRSVLHLRSIITGANDRLDMVKLFSFDYEQGEENSLLSDLDPEQEQEANAKQYTRGMNTLVFVPWHMVNTTDLNLPMKQMDFYVPG